jgi:hypothetical protein
MVHPKVTLKHVDFDLTCSDAEKNESKSPPSCSLIQVHSGVPLKDVRGLIPRHH